MNVRRLFVVCTAAAMIVASAGPLSALIRKVDTDKLDELAVFERSFNRGRVVAPFTEVEGRAPNADAWSAYLTELGKEADVYLDLATGGAALVRGTPEAWIPGAGNELTTNDLESVVGTRVTQVDAGVVQILADEFLERHAELLRVPLTELVPRTVEKVSDSLWVVTYEHVIDGVPVSGSRLTCVVGHGNLIVWGTRHVFPAAPAEATRADIDAATARSIVGAYVDWDSRTDAIAGEPRLSLVPEAVGSLTGTGPLGEAVRHRLVWELSFVRSGVTGTWGARVDAVTGELLEFGDQNRYGWVRGGVQPATWSDAEKLWPLPLVDIGTGYTSAEGLFTDPGGTVTGTLNGELTEIQDQCGTPGWPSVDADADGNINYGTGPPNPDGDADCTDNGVGNDGGAHNTHAARSAYYHITWIKDKGRKWLPSNSWLDSSHEVQVNIDDVCNAFWSPWGGYNGFFMEGYSGSIHCYNTGEIASIFLHEVGHGLDQYDAQGTADGGTGEAYSDTHAMLQLHDSCIGDGFWNQQCTGYGFPCVDCTGVRDIDYALHVDGSGDPIEVPFTPANFTGPQCSSGSGPCGKEVHCEAYPGAGAIWDLAVRKLPTGYDEATAWYITERDWYLGMQIATAMYNCNSTTYESDGCATDSWYQAMLAADDDDGNLTNGTPHAAHIFEAFNDHAIACGAAGDPENQNHSSCPSLDAPVLNASATPSTIELSWAGVGEADEYVILRNHGACDEGYVEVAVVPSGTTTYSDSTVATYMSYSYRVYARTSNDACYSAFSNCAQASIGDCPGATGVAPGLTNPEDNRVDVTWDDGGSCSAFNVYRRQGGCADGGFSKVGVAVAASPYSDTTVSGGVTYGYRITGSDATGQLETGYSPCAEITPTGVCNEVPTFAGLESAANSHTSACGIDLAWSAGSTICSGQDVVYNVYRETAAGFVPGPSNRVATGVIGTTWHDGGVAYGTAYHYIVRAEALSGAGPGPSGGVEDANLVRLSAAPSGPDTELFADDMEGGTAGWTPADGPNDDGGGNSPWEQVTDDSHSPSTSWFCADEDPGTAKDQVLETAAAVSVPAGAPAVLEFWHHYDTESGYDGGVLEYSTDDGDTWHDILEGDGGSIPADADRFLAGGYNDTLASGYSNPLPDRQAWAGDSGGWELVEVNFSDFAGADVVLRWRLGCDSSVGSYPGWWVDDVRIYYGSSCGGCLIPPLFAGVETVTDHGSDQAAVDLTWSEGTDQCSTDGLIYRVYVGPDSGSVDYGTPIVVTEGTAATVMGLLAGTEYCFAVRATDGLGNQDGNSAVTCGTASSAQVGTGDADCGGTITTADIQRVVGVIFGSQTDCGSGYQAADVNCSGGVDSNDVSSLIGYLKDGY